MQYLSSQTYCNNEKKLEYHKFHDFWIWKRIARDWEVIEPWNWQMLIYYRETTARGFDTLCKILWPLSLAESAINVKNREISDIHAFVFF